MGRIVKHRALMLMAFAASCAFSQAPAPARRTVGRYPDGRPIVMASLTGPSSEAYFEGFVVRVAGSAGVAVGLERPRETGAASADSQMQPLLLSGKTVDDALAAVLGAASRRVMAGAGAPTYRLNWTHGLAHISAFSGRPTLLDADVSAFSVRDQPLETAVQTLLFFMHVRGAPPAPGTRSSNGLLPPKSLFNPKGVTLSIAHATARDVLNALVLASGDASWVVRYGPHPLNPQDAVFVLMTFDGRGIQID